MLEIQEIPVGKIEVGDYEQRLEIKNESIDGLAASIGRVGVLAPLIVRKQGDSFSLVAGHRRLLAAIRVGLSTVPCLLEDGGQDLAAEKAFAENFFREDLSLVELACALKDCIDDDVLTVQELAAGFHRSVRWVRDMIAIVTWPEDVQQAVHLKQLSLAAAANLALVKDATYRDYLLETAVTAGATARVTAAWLQGWREMRPPEEAVEMEPVSSGAVSRPDVPQAPCFQCNRIFPMDQMSYVPFCGDCVQIIREASRAMKQE